ncbi:hypothetical protein [Faecalibacterium gallinarum]|uniref:GLUG domain-containing protein n=1 Tax=Faecalibacterium gallinarum TaxID=2903556 RepID=A0AA37MV33_9FIRM|nr:hypothetical protein [Faecalibacterium gallinarum]GJN63989.1 hypothetical protein JCM17207_06140 [Faecalibacterium gallinarum]
MKHLKRWLALSISAVLVLSLLTGCSGNIRSNVLFRLLKDELENVQVDTDSDFDRALKTAIQEGGANAEDVQAALAKELNLAPYQVDFSIPALEIATPGQQAVNVVFVSDSDINIAAMRAAVQWQLVLQGLPKEDQYSARVSAVRSGSGYFLAIHLTVEQIGNQGGDEPSEPAPITTPDELVTAIQDAIENNSTRPIVLTSKYKPGNLTTVILADAGIQGGTLDCGGVRIVIPENVTIEGGLFTRIEAEVTLKNLNLEIRGKVTHTGRDAAAGGIAWYNSGIIEDCHVTLSGTGSIFAETTQPGSQARAGGIAGVNDDDGQIISCTLTGGSITAEAVDLYARAGGIAGFNDGTISGDSNVVCAVSDCVIKARTSSSSAFAGGIAGYNSYKTIQNCKVSDSTIIAEGSRQYADAIAGNEVYDKDTCTHTNVNVTL